MYATHVLDEHANVLAVVRDRNLCTALNIARTLGLHKSKVNSILYRLEKAGQVTHADTRPPTWTFRQSVPQGSASSPNNVIISPTTTSMVPMSIDAPLAQPQQIVVSAADYNTASTYASPSPSTNFEIKLRAYQLRIVQNILGPGNAKAQNALVLLPTGAGKTLVAAELIKRRAAHHVHVPTDGTHSSFKALFLVPSCFLVEQQAISIRDWTGLRVGEYMGGQQLPSLSSMDVLVSTPEAFRSAQQKHPQELAWPNWGLVVFDEVHHVLKSHPYGKIARSIPTKACVQVVGLTASLTYAITESKVREATTRLVKELRIQTMETATQEELQSGGYHASTIEAEVDDVIQIPPHIQDAERTLPLAQRQPHLMHATFWKRQRDGDGRDIANDMVAIVRQLESAVAHFYPHFQSPLSGQSLASWGAYARSVGPKRANGKPTGSAKVVCALLEHWYEALRIILTNWEDLKGCELAVMYLRMMGCNTAAYEEVSWGAASNFFTDYEVTPTFDHLKGILAGKKERAEQREQSLQCLIFVQQKSTAHILAHFLNTDDTVRDTLGLKAVPLHSTTKAPSSPSMVLSPAQAKANLLAFAAGAVNLLVTTTVAEEGVDIASANCVIRFDPMLTGVSFVQGRGRARQEDSSFVVMSQHEDRTAAQLATVEKLQQSIVSVFDPIAAVTVGDVEKEKQAQ